MAKNRQCKRRLFKVYSDFYGKPFVRFGGKYLTHELGLACGDRLELTSDNDTITLRKLSEAEMVEYERTEEERAKLSLIKKLLPIGAGAKQPISMLVAESRTNEYSVEDEITKHLKRYLQA